MYWTLTDDSKADIYRFSFFHESQAPINELTEFKLNIISTPAFFLIRKSDPAIFQIKRISICNYFKLDGLNWNKKRFS